MAGSPGAGSPGSGSPGAGSREAGSPEADSAGADSAGDKEPPTGAVTTVTAVVSLAADCWFELQVAQYPGLVVHAARLEDAETAVVNALSQLTGRDPGEFEVHLQY
ncbi:hypothetical protein ACPFL9_19925 [Paenarthrobacter sp. NyZ202]|uniref:hypothetical protein n=1 Tax=Paenarthrobacter sp. NyZ202 TaxID=3402689 RepID=UPI003CE77670